MYINNEQLDLYINLIGYVVFPHKIIRKRNHIV